MDERTKKSEYTAVPIRDFIAGAVLPVDVFIQLSESKIIQIAHAGERVQMERIRAYEQKDVTHLLIRTSNYTKYLNEGFNVAGVIIKNKEIAQTQRQTVLTKMASNVFSHIETMGLNQETFQNSRVVTALTISLCSGKVDLYQLMSEFAMADQTLYGHAVAVSTVSVMIGMGLNWKSVTIEKLGLGGLLHDIGKQELPAALVKKSRMLMNKEEVVQYESHCIRGMEMLRAITDIPDDVIDIAYEHHEACNGRGFPRKIKQMYINPLARVVGLADKFCQTTMKNAAASFPKTPREALEHIQKNLGQSYWPEAMDVLKTLAPDKNRRAS